MDEKNILLITVGVLLLFVLILLGAVLFLVYRMTKVQTQVAQTNDDKNESKGEPTEFEKIKELLQAQYGAKSEPSDFYCQNHPQDHAVGVCAICSESFCDECIKEHDGLTFCQSHFREYLENEWVELEEVMTTPDTPETALHIYDFKKDIWKDETTSSIVSTHYKINIENDFIESYVKLLVKKDESEELEIKFKSYKNTDVIQ
ncbi:MAG: hypothetical protein GY909_02260 [Oligoflexia bacterium]|nr:hypothetical protein [Oligoflexia bacterium]